MFFDLLVGSIINQLLVSERFEQDDKEFEELKTKLTMALENSSIIEGVMPLWLLKSKFMKWRTKTTFAPFDFIYEVGQKGIQRRYLTEKKIPFNYYFFLAELLLLKMEHMF